MKIQVGDHAEFSKTITDEDVRVFADLTGDHNPVHLDDQYASGTRFQRRVAHGMLTASLISSVLANKLPGEGTVYLSQSLKFVAPVYLNDTVTARVTITQIREDKPIATLETICVNQHGEMLVKGEAVVLFSIE
ncbi:MAG: 3-hydroxybutyryl-CoA dehydratase [Acidobacteriota bacterium]|jgi:3-hydroxybutyryl-CoA dehydratase|nr:3-hydroxybutyryl-CoA dehydratase [Acidobacteriota bacterium]